MKPTIYDVADRAGVSISTVSLALNAPSRVKPATLQRVMESVDHLGYVPKTEAVLRARRGVGRIGLIAPFTSFPSAFARRLNGVLEEFSTDNYEVIVFDQPSAARSRLVTLPLTRRVDGLIIMSVPFEGDVEQRLDEQGIPTVVVEIGHAGFSNVLIDQRDGGVQVGRHLLGRGHERFAYLGHRQEHDYPSQSLQKLEGYASVLPQAPLVRDIEYGYDEAVAAALEMLAGDDRPTAIFAHDDLLASGVLHAAASLGLEVPRDLAVVGFNDAELAAPMGLTTVRQPFEESGRVAARSLIALLADPRSSRRETILGVTLVERTSS